MAGQLTKTGSAPAIRLGPITYDVAMARWEPNARQRLERAALTLFAEHGYDDTTVAEIADRAGLTKSTFFRHFADKREVLFGGQDILLQLFTDAIGSAPASATPAACLAAALESAAIAFTQERHDLAEQRRAVVAANPELHERELLKRARLSSAMADALRARGTDETTARLAAEIGMLAFSTTYACWAAPDNRQAFAEIADATLRDLQARATALGADITARVRPRSDEQRGAGCDRLADASDGFETAGR
jgi:AcrR family transcriptional regulator